jgi:microcystin-dependent protein
MLHETQRNYPGDMKITARSSAQPGWFICNGADLSRTSYPRLFDAIGTVFGSASGSTFKIPDMRGRFPMGVGDSHGLGESGGSGTVDVAIELGSHTHTHSHGGGNLVFTHTHTERAHTHPGAHSHGVAATTHNHLFAHKHDVDIASFDSGDRNNTTPGGPFRWDEPNVSSGAEDHSHNVNPPNTTSSDPNAGSATGYNSSFSTQDDTNVFSASWTGSKNGPDASPSWTGGTDSDSSPADLSTITSNVDILNKFQVINYTIFTGVIP